MSIAGAELPAPQIHLHSDGADTAAYPPARTATGED